MENWEYLYDSSYVLEKHEESQKNKRKRQEKEARDKDNFYGCVWGALIIAIILLITWIAGK